jgi:hypothetical protein
MIRGLPRAPKPAKSLGVSRRTQGKPEIFNSGFSLSNRFTTERLHHRGSTEFRRQNAESRSADVEGNSHHQDMCPGPDKARCQKLDARSQKSQAFRLLHSVLRILTSALSAQRICVHLCLSVASLSVSDFRAVRAMNLCNLRNLWIELRASHLGHMLNLRLDLCSSVLIRG